MSLPKTMANNISKKKAFYVLERALIRLITGNPIEETVEIGEIQTRPDEVDYEPVSSTLWRQREEYCARVIQNAYKKFSVRQKGENVDADNGDAKEATTTEHETSVLVENEGSGHKVVVHSRSPSIASGSGHVKVSFLE